MPHILKNKNLEVRIDLPFENYNFTRFDQTGKIVDVLYKGTSFATIERTDDVDQNKFGQGFYNEFGIEIPVGFEDLEIGQYFHKIGVGLLRKESNQYFFLNEYQLEKAKFENILEKDRLRIICTSGLSHGYSYILTKDIILDDHSFRIEYSLENNGVMDIKTAEYIHNFISIDKDLIGKNYILKFPFELDSRAFSQSINKEKKAQINGSEITFENPPNEPIFYSHLNGHKIVEATWELFNLEKNLGVREIGNFTTNKVNLWGWTHVVSPELFYMVDVKPQEIAKWSRTYQFFEINE